MKILILSSEFHPFRGGIATYAMEMAKAASEAGHRVTVVAADYGSATQETFPFRIIRYRGGQHSARDLPRKIALVRRLMWEEPDFDIVHAVDWPFHIPLALSHYRGSTRCIVSFHGTEASFMQHPKRALPLKLLRFWSGWAEYVANSADTATRLRDAFRLAPDAVRVTRLGVGREWLFAGIPKDEARRSLAIPEDRFVIASLGRVVPRKGYDLLCEALSALPDEIASRIEWQIVGPLLDADYAARLRDLSARTSAIISFTDSLPQRQVAQRLSAADLFCLPARRVPGGGIEGFGLAYLEAGALGLPSLATAIGGIPDAVDHGESGLLVPENDHNALAAALLRLHRDPQERARLAAGARRRAQASSWHKTMSETYGAEEGLPTLRPTKMHELWP
ncbi:MULTISPECIES: glycosyltransferase family 4 protein [unclassified Rhizobium]|uniref:glycosyltransferase family 4 protein n=1 Tax=unclassified Rhizobium TaxID=2613769 RepID=UPI0006FE246C|nr:MULTISPECIES: glycosyltransferase family 4 protein [unclassified Rhizobium]KQV43465.1 hypothetical protein ASC86_01215 [Rhizobium sp. Root1212]KRD37650.1 hypothetical protein ASE37_01215 [Rhizobium sp. Root268]